MGKSKKTLVKQVKGIKQKIAKLEAAAKNDPLHRHPEIYDELAKLRKKLDK